MSTVNKWLGRLVSPIEVEQGAGSWEPSATKLQAPSSKLQANNTATLWQASCLPPFGPPLAVLVLLLQTSRGVIRSGATPLVMGEDGNTIE